MPISREAKIKMAELVPQNMHPNTLIHKLIHSLLLVAVLSIFLHDVGHFLKDQLDSLEGFKIPINGKISHNVRSQCEIRPFGVLWDL